MPPEVVDIIIYTRKGSWARVDGCSEPLTASDTPKSRGTWKRYANEPRVQLVVLRKLAENGRARVPRYHCMHTRLFARRTLPDVLFWKILEFWRTDRDP